MKSLTCFSSRSRGTCCAVIFERLAENCRGRTTSIICTRTNAPKYILESHRLHFGSICDQNGRNFEPCLFLILSCHCDNLQQMTKSVCLEGKYPPTINDIDLKEEVHTICKRIRLWALNIVILDVLDTVKETHQTTTLPPSRLVLKWKYFELAQY